MTFRVGTSLFTVKNRIDDVCNKEFDHLILHYLFHIRVEALLVYCYWPVIMFHYDLVGAEGRTNPLNI